MWSRGYYTGGLVATVGGWSQDSWALFLGARKLTAFGIGELGLEEAHSIVALVLRQTHCSWASLQRCIELQPSRTEGPAAEAQPPHSFAYHSPYW